jgi:transcription factor SPN1
MAEPDRASALPCRPLPTLTQLAACPGKRLQLDMMIDGIVKGGKRANRPKKRKKNEEELDQYADEEVSRLREMMLAAADDDIAANKEKLPATAKLRLLSTVMDVLRKGSLWQGIVDNNLMEGVRRWLEPLPDRSLPALNIQKDFMEILPVLEIDTAVLKESRLGRVVLFYTKCKRVTPDIRRTADRLMANWTRPIVKRSASYRDRAIPIAAPAPHERERERLGSILARAKDDAGPRRTRPNAVSIPQRELGAYTVAPQSNVGALKSNVSVDMDIERRKRNAERLRNLTRKMQGQSRG